MELLETKLRRVREAMGRFSLNGNHVRSRPCVTWADDDEVINNSNTNNSPRLMQRIQSFTMRTSSPNVRQRSQQLDNRPSPSPSCRVRRLFYANSMPTPGTSQISPTSSTSNMQSGLHGVSSSPCLRRMAHAGSPHQNSFTLPVRGILDNRPQGSPSPEFPSPGSGKDTPMAVSPNLAAKVLFSRPLSVNYRNADMETFFEESDFVTDCVHWHNILRQKHQAPPMLLSSELCQSAQEWANHMAHNETFYHRNPRNVGENLFTRFSCAPEFDVSGREAVLGWYCGIKQYNFNAEPDLQHCNAGQFTQLVWKNTTEIGVGKARARGGKIFVVAHYRPQGNIIGQFNENVLPPVHSDVSPNETSGLELPSPEATSSSTAS